MAFRSAGSVLSRRFRRVPPLLTRFQRIPLSSLDSCFSSQQGSCRFFIQAPTQQQQGKCQEDVVAVDEARRLLRLVNVEAVKKRLESDRQEWMSCTDLLHLCQTMGAASSHEDAERFVRALDDAGVVLVFRGKAYLHPQQVAELVSNVVPLTLTSEDDPRRLELEQLRSEKAEIDKIAHRKVHTFLWSIFGLMTLHTAFYVRLTFWEFSWDVMEPIAYFVTNGCLIAGYAYFLVTSRDPTYQDFMKRLFTSKQQRLMKRRNFNIQRLLELERQCHADLKHFNSSNC